MSFGFSVGDIILCMKIAHRLFFAVTRGRKAAPRDLRELESVLLGLYCSLNNLQIATETIFSRTTRKSNEDTVCMKQQLESMIHSCLQTLNELEKVTRKYREAAHDPPSLPNSQYSVVSLPFSQQFRAQTKIQWRRLLWDLKGDSLSRYREKLQAHTDGINLVLNTFIWSATNRLEEDGRRQTQKIDELLQQASHLNSIASQFMQNVQAAMSTTPDTFTLPDRASSASLLGSSLVPIATDMSNCCCADNAQNLPMVAASQASTSTRVPIASETSNVGTQMPSRVQFRSTERPFRLPGVIETIKKTQQVASTKELSANLHITSTPSITEPVHLAATSQNRACNLVIERLNKRHFQSQETMHVKSI